MDELINFIKTPKITIGEYGKMLWDAIFPEPKLLKFCPDCGHKLQWIPLEKLRGYQFEKPAQYWGCMKCILRGPQKFKTSESESEPGFVD